MGLSFSLNRTEPSNEEPSPNAFRVARTKTEMAESGQNSEETVGIMEERAETAQETAEQTEEPGPPIWHDVPPTTLGSQSRRRQPIAPVVASLLIACVVVGSLVVAMLTTQQHPETNAASDVVQSGPDDGVPSADEPSPPVSHAVEAPTSDLLSGSESRYSADYAAQVDAVAQDGLRIHISITAHGKADLRRPETSCLIISGTDGRTYVARPTDTTLTTDERGHFVARLSFPAIITGTYGFQYSCAGDYTTADLGSVNVPSVGISRYSEEYYAVILGFDGIHVHFVAHGRSDLRGPESSCVIRDDQSLIPAVAIDSKWVGEAITYTGTMKFSSEVAGGSFVYSCSGYSEVLLS